MDEGLERIILYGTARNGSEPITAQAFYVTMDLVDFVQQREHRSPNQEHERITQNVADAISEWRSETKFTGNVIPVYLSGLPYPNPENLNLLGVPVCCFTSVSNSPDNLADQFDEAVDEFLRMHSERTNETHYLKVFVPEIIVPKEDWMKPQEIAYKLFENIDSSKFEVPTDTSVAIYALHRTTELLEGNTLPTPKEEALVMLVTPNLETMQAFPIAKRLSCSSEDIQRDLDAYRRNIARMDGSSFRSIGTRYAIGFETNDLSHALPLGVKRQCIGVFSNEQQMVEAIMNETHRLFNDYIRAEPEKPLVVAFLDNKLTFRSYTRDANE